MTLPKNGFSVNPNLRLRIEPVIVPAFEQAECKSFAFRPFYQRAEPIHRINLAVPLVQPEREFVDVKLGVFGRKRVVSAIKTSL